MEYDCFHFSIYVCLSHTDTFGKVANGTAKVTYSLCACVSAKCVWQIESTAFHVEPSWWMWKNTYIHFQADVRQAQIYTMWHKLVGFLDDFASDVVACLPACLFYLNWLNCVLWMERICSNIYEEEEEKIFIFMVHSGDNFIFIRSLSPSMALSRCLLIRLKCLHC